MKNPIFANIFKWSACLALVCTPASIAADDFDDFFKEAQKDFEDFKKGNEKDFEDFRKQINEEMLEFMKNPWVKIRPEKPKPVPVEPEPIVIEYDEEKEREREKNAPAPKPQPIKQTIPTPKPKPQPQPVAPIEIKKPPLETKTVRMYGTDFTVAKPTLPALSLGGNINDDNVRRSFEKLVKADTDGLLKNCLDARASHNLCDWGYIKLLQKVSESFYGADNNASRLLWGFLMQQSGYSIRFGHNGSSTLYPLFASDDVIYDLPYFFIDGKMFFVLKKEQTSLYFCDFKYPGEQSVSMAVNAVPVLAESKAPARQITVHSYPDIKLSVSVNKNLIDFYNEFPQSTLGADPYAKWALFGNVPATTQLRAIYPTLRGAIAGKNQRDAASILLKVAQTFPYGYDDEIWGGDRAFFPDETWYYPKSDCEDHAIHFSRLVRDLMGLDVALVYYPGHLSAAVAFTDNTVSGDYVIHNGRPYTFCDATYFYAPVGKSAPSNDNSQAILIDLKR